MSTLRELGLYLVKALDSRRQITAVEPTQDGAIALLKDGSTLPVKISQRLEPSQFCNGYVIAANERENVQTLIDNWHVATSLPKLTVIFLEAKTGEKWLLRPHIHAKIAEPKTLAQGIFSLFDQSRSR